MNYSFPDRYRHPGGCRNHRFPGHTPAKENHRNPIGRRADEAGLSNNEMNLTRPKTSAMFILDSGTAVFFCP